MEVSSSSELKNAFEHCLPLYCSECQSQNSFSIDKFNDFKTHPSHWYCCCLQLKDEQHKCKINTQFEIVRSECCSVCSAVKIIKSISCEFIYKNDIIDKEQCSKCSDLIIVKFMDCTFNTLFEAHEYARSLEIASILKSTLNINN
jgi:hypothetical protein